MIEAQDDLVHARGLAHARQWAEAYEAYTAADRVSMPTRSRNGATWLTGRGSWKPRSKHGSGPSPSAPPPARGGRLAEARRVLEGCLAQRSAAERVERTFMFTDIVRSTGLLEALGDEAWTELLRWHDRALRETFQHMAARRSTMPAMGSW